MRERPFAILLLSLLSLCLHPPAPATAVQIEPAIATIQTSHGEVPADPQIAKELSAAGARGDRKAKERDFAGAIAEFTRCIELAPRDARGYNARGTARYLNGDRTGAAADYKQAIGLAPKFAPPYSNLAQIDVDLKDDSEAEANLNRALELRPDDVGACYLRAMVRQRQGRDNEANKDLAHVVALPAQNATAYMTRGEAHNHLGHPAEAAVDYRRAIALGENSPHSFFRLAYFQAQEHQYAAALEDAQRSIRQPAGKDADYPQLLYWTLQARLGDPGKADERLSAYLAARPHDAEGEWVGHVGAFLLGRESEDALFTQAASGDAKKTDGQRCEAWYYAGIKKLVEGDKAGAGERFRKCVATKKSTFGEYKMARSELQTL